jgi:hypothetical protein
MAAAAAPRPQKPKEEAPRSLPISAKPRTAPQSSRPSNPARSSLVTVGPTSSGVVDLASSQFAPPQSIADEIEASKNKGLDVRVIAKGIAQEGRIKIRQNSKKKYVSMGRGSMPLLNPWTQKLGGMFLNFDVENSGIKNGLASFKENGGDRNDWLQALKKDSTSLGGLGLKINNLPQPVNKFENGILALGVSGLKVGVGNYLDATFDLMLENLSAPKVIGTAKIDIGGAEKKTLTLESNGDKLTGSVSLATTYKSFSGSIKVSYLADGSIDIAGKAAYSADKLSGEIAFVATDEATAKKFAKDAIAAAGGKENVQNAGTPAPVPVAKPGNKKRSLAATGMLNFNLTNWFAGTVNVVVDGKGMITVIGKIAPPGEIILFKQRDWDKQLIKFEAKAYYGIPVVGNLNLFANISLNALAKLGPAKLYNIEILGTYSTDPEIQKNIQISGSINISAYAGLRLRAEGGAGIEILDHDLKFGVGLTADVGVKAYADARPTIGYRDPGVFYISGTLDMVAQPMLGLGGDFFIAVVTPWWSPLSDKRWTWPLFSKEWPLSDPIGISATLKDYVLGSGAVPEIEFKKPEFDPSKFMTNMVDDNLPSKSGKGGDGKGGFKEDGSVAKPVVLPKKNPAKPQPNKPNKKGGAPTGGKSGKPNADAAKAAANSKNLQIAAKKLNTLKGKGPFARGDLDKELEVIRAQAAGVSFDVQAMGAKWRVTPKPGGKKATGVVIGAKSDKLADGELGETVTFSAEDGGHKLWIDVKGDRPQLMLASTVQPLINHLSAFKTKAEKLDPKPKAAVLEAISIANPIVQEIARWTKQAVGKEFGDKKRDEADSQIEIEEAKLRNPLKLILDTLGVKVPDKIKNIPVKFLPGSKAKPYPVEYNRQLKRQEIEINKMTVHIWMQRRDQFKEADKTNLGKVDKKARNAAREKMIEILAERLTHPWNPAKPGPIVKQVQKMTGVQSIVDDMFASASVKDQKNGFEWNDAYVLAKKGMEGQNVLHEPDKVAGGRYDKIADIGLGEVNQDIGGKWPKLAKGVEDNIRTQMAKKNISETLWRKPKMDLTLSV